MSVCNFHLLNDSDGHDFNEQSSKLQAMVSKSQLQRALFPYGFCYFGFENFQ